MASENGSDQPDGTDGAGETPPNAVERLVERFGGIRPMAEKIGVPVSTVQGWKKRGAIPAARLGEVKAAAGKHAIVLDEADLDGAFRIEERAEGERPDTAEPALPAEPQPAPAVDEGQASPAPAPALSPYAAAAAERRSSGSSSGIAVVAALLALVGAGVAVTSPVWSPEFLHRAETVTKLETRVGEMEKKLGVTVSANASLTDRVAALETAVAALGRKVAGVGALAARDLGAALAGGTPFPSELAAVRASGMADEATAKALDAVAPFAVTGVPTRDRVEDGFAWLLPAVARADVGAFDSGVGGRMWGWVTGMASALRLPASAPADATATPGLLARAAGMMDEGELAAAVDLVAMLEGPAADAAAPWLADARARLAADRAAAMLATRVAALGQ